MAFGHRPGCCWIIAPLSWRFMAVGDTFVGASARIDVATTMGLAVINGMDGGGACR